MIRILVSNFSNYDKINDEKITHPMDNINGIVDQIKKYLKGNKKALFIASDINSSFESIEGYASIFFDSLKMVNIIFDEYVILYGENKEHAKEYINDASLILLCGGSTYNQHVFFETIDLKELLKEYDGLVIGQSAGALNMEMNVFNSPEEQENSEPIFFEGLGLTDISIEPHFIYDVSLFDDNQKYQRDAIIKESYNRIIYGQCDGSYILIDNDNNKTVYGEIYLINNGDISLICQNGESKKI